MKQAQTKALTRISQRIARKHRIQGWFHFYVFNRCGSREGQIGNFILENIASTHREIRRIKGMLPELISALKRTAKASGFKGVLEWDEAFEQFGVTSIQCG